MIKKYILGALLLILIPGISNAQQKDTLKTKMDQLLSTTGKIIKISDYALPTIQSDQGDVYPSIRIFESNGKSHFFYRLSKSNHNVLKETFIAEEDLIKIIKVLNSLKQSVEIDKNAKSYYMEKKFVTIDGFEIGYDVKGSNKNLTWFMTLKQIEIKTKIYFVDFEIIDKSLKAANIRIKDLKS